MQVCECVCVFCWWLAELVEQRLPLRADVSAVIFSGAHQAIRGPGMYFA